MLGIGSILNERYRIDRMLEINALGARYRAFDLEREVQVSIAEIQPQPGTQAEDLPELEEQFQIEAAALQVLHHAGIAQVVDYFLSQEPETTPFPGVTSSRIQLPNAYIVSEYIEGISLAQLIVRHGLQTETNVLLWTEDLLKALSYCHRHNVYHHDIQPKSIIITPDNHAVLVSFEVLGLWKANDPSTWTAKRVMGVPEYASPERWTNRNWRQDPASDLYSLGATLYTALTGTPPTNAGDRISNPYQFVQVKTLTPQVGGPTKNVILKAMSLPRNKRYRTAGEMLRDLKSSQYHSKGDAQPIPAPFTTLPKKPFPWRNIIGILLSAVMIWFSAVLGFRLNDFFHPQQTTETTVVTSTPHALSLDEEFRSDATTTADPSATENAEPDELPAQSTTIVLSTPTSIPDIGSILGSEGVAVPEGWNVAIDDPFDDSGFAWPIGIGTGENTISRSITQGVYRWELSPTSPLSRYCTPDNGSDYADMVVSATARLLQGPETAAFGLVLREDTQGYYIFSVRNDGFYLFALWDNAQGWNAIVDWSTTNEVVPYGSNTLTAVISGTHFELYINDTYVDEADDTTITRGDVGLAITTAAYDNTVIYEFDNFVQYTPETVLIRRSE